ncbi:hypothetical protein CAPTEDRAFT_220827 [Capitella teleta]|uniref:Protein MIX23 n=1 Tax=Capitella teleta TaxID=283909 RepID=R7U1V3_CAPTE|nr:hypothetical protein CAPTEDRAFT_220827 [Capitella teleta]|eukprot:ELU00209.1 hypothetical protein CAPTEDRAFT_220827 [Capitella teleta]
MASASQHEAEISCDDFTFFQQILTNLRTIDDRVVHSLNTSIPTQSFAEKVDAASRCSDLFKELSEAHKHRDGIIKKCITLKSATVSQLKQRKQQEPDNIDLMSQIRKEQYALRHIQSELNVEEVINDRSMTIFQERCRQHFRPPPS